MSDPFVPEADALDQQREVVPQPEEPEEDDDTPQPALAYPPRFPIEAAEADVLEQAQEVEEDPDERF